MIHFKGNKHGKMDVAVLGLGVMGEPHVGAAKTSPYVRNVYGYEPTPERASCAAGNLGSTPPAIWLRS